MSTSTSIRIDQTLYDQARSEAVSEHRTIAGQIEYWAKVGRAALDNPDLPVSFVAESLASLAEPRSEATPFVPRSIQKPGREAKRFCRWSGVRLACVLPGRSAARIGLQARRTAASSVRQALLG